MMCEDNNDAITSPSLSPDSCRVLLRVIFLPFLNRDGGKITRLNICNAIAPPFIAALLGALQSPSSSLVQL